MHLLCTSSPDLKLKEFMGDPPESYAIVSHRWEEQEVLFADIGCPNITEKAGYRKIAFAIDQAKADGYEYLWVDTCCIDKSSSAELSEAINSMYYWYQQAAVCYAYLSDIENPGHSFCESKWFTRGWTLQELLAPEHLVFYTRDWQPIGTKRTLRQSISKVTKIPLDILDGSVPIESASVSRRMSWASNRETTRVEDMAYCLLGLFSVNMPLLYGERNQAFVRLQQEIIKVTDDQTLFAWIDPHARNDEERGMLAEHPRFFKYSADFLPYTDPVSREPPSMINRRLKIEVRTTTYSDGSTGSPIRAHLCCAKSEARSGTFVIHLKRTSLARNEFKRIRCNEMQRGISPRGLIPVIVPQNVLTSAISKRAEVYLIPDQIILFRNLHNNSGFQFKLVSYAARFDAREEMTTEELSSLRGMLQSNREWMPDDMPYFFMGQQMPNRIAFTVRFDVSAPCVGSSAKMLLAMGMAEGKTLGVWIERSTATKITVDEVQASVTRLKTGKAFLFNIPIHLSSADPHKEVYSKCYMSLEVNHIVKYSRDCHIVAWRFDKAPIRC